MFATHLRVVVAKLALTNSPNPESVAGSPGSFLRNFQSADAPSAFLDDDYVPNAVAPVASRGSPERRRIKFFCVIIGHWREFSPTPTARVDRVNAIAVY